MYTPKRPTEVKQPHPLRLESSKGKDLGWFDPSSKHQTIALLRMDEGLAHISANGGSNVDAAAEEARSGRTKQDGIVSVVVLKSGGVELDAAEDGGKQQEQGADEPWICPAEPSSRSLGRGRQQRSTGSLRPEKSNTSPRSLGSNSSRQHSAITGNDRFRAVMRPVGTLVPTCAVTVHG